jgi:predicted TIM-barrel fold metal-dependent hydrolase
MNARRIKPEFARHHGTAPSRETQVEPSTEEKRDLVKRLNRWACAIGTDRPRLIQFMAAEPMLFGKQLVDEVEECLGLGAKGVKVHPGNGRHLPDDPNLYPVYELCQQRGIPLLTDTGGEERNGVRPLNEPEFWIPVLRKFPRLRLIMAHFCGEYWEERVQIAQQFRGDNLVFDIAGGLVDDRHPIAGHRHLPSSQAPRIFRKVGIDRILFGSDGPFHDPRDAAQQVVALDLTDSERERILSRNAKDYLNID